ncbi:MAG: DciA family protein [Vulcanimicrobiaceae bacterium]
MTLRSLKTAVITWKPAAERAEDSLVTIREAWPAIVGGDVAQHSRPGDLTRGALTIVTRSSAWSQQLSFLSERILDAVRERTGVGVERIRFRVGRIVVRSDAAGAAVTRKDRSRSKRSADQRVPPATLEEALARFREDVQAVQRAKAAAGWKKCNQCEVWIAPSAGAQCLPCVNALAEQRTRAVARLLYDAPWLGYAGVAELVEELTQQEYESIRKRLLQRWWDALARIAKSGRRALTHRERMIASSYVLLKSGLEPERIAPAVVRDLLGDELHGILYGNESN